MVDAKELNFCSIHKMIVRLELLCDLLVSQVSRIPVAEMQDWLVGCGFLPFRMFDAVIDPLRSVHRSSVKW